MVEQELNEALAEAMGHGHGVQKEQMEAKREVLRPMFESMPKNLWGKIDRDAMQYMVRRYFGGEHGWSISGFDKAGGGTSSGGSVAASGLQKGSSTATTSTSADDGSSGSSSTNRSNAASASKTTALAAATLLREKLPFYVETVLASRLDHQGFELNDVVAAVVVLERIIFDENLEIVEDAYYLNNFSPSDLLEKDQFQEVMMSYMMLY